MKNSVINFNSGILTPQADVRVDTDKYPGGCRILENMLPEVYGCATRRPGSELIDASIYIPTEEEELELTDTTAISSVEDLQHIAWGYATFENASGTIAVGETITYQTTKTAVVREITYDTETTGSVRWDTQTANIANGNVCANGADTITINSEPISPATMLAGNYYLAGNIDCSDYNWSGTEGFYPIGTATVPFTGTLNGHRLAINNLTVNKPATANSALFRFTDGATLYNFRVNDATIVGAGASAVVVSSPDDTDIQNVYVNTATVTTTGNQSGGFVGGSGGGGNDNTITACSIKDVTITATGQVWTGLFAGSINAVYTDCYASGEIVNATGYYNGGFIGLARTDGSYTRCKVYGTIPAQADDNHLTNGGFCGACESGTMDFTECYYLESMNDLPFGGEDEQVRLLVAGASTPTGGTYTITFDGITTDDVVYNASEAVLQAALDDAFGTGVLDCSGGYLRHNVSNYIYFRKQYSRIDVGALTVDGSSLTGAGSPYTINVTVTNEAVYPTVVSESEIEDYPVKTRENEMVRLIPFIYNSDIAYPVELGEYYASFFYDGELLDGDGAPIETPYLADDINAINIRQIADTMWMVHPDYPPAKLTRTTTTTFSHDNIDFNYGPFLTRNDILNDDDVTMTYTGDLTVGSTGTLEASAAYFDNDHVGALFLIIHPKAAISVTNKTANTTSDYLPIKGAYNFTTTGAWLGTVHLWRSVDDGASYDVFKTYTGLTVGARNIILSKSEAEYGISMAIHVDTGMTGGTNGFGSSLEVVDTYQNGIVKITAVTDSTTATVEVMAPVAATATATKRWAEGSWSDVEGYPAGVCFYGDRCVYGGGRTLWFSRVGDYENFDVGTNDDDAFEVALTTTNEITWVDTIDEVIVVGTTGEPWVVQSNKVGSPITATNFNAREQAGFGSAKIQGVKVNNAVLFVDSVNKKVMELAYNADEQKYATPDMTVLAEHLTQHSTITGIAHQKNPDSILWVWLDDGTCLSLTYNREQNVVAWAEHPVDGDVKTMCVIPSIDEDEVWLGVERTINTIATTCIERFAQRRLPTSFEDCFFVDCGLTYDGAATNTLTAEHLIGETVTVLGTSGSTVTVYNDLVVSSEGIITLPDSATVTKAQYGLPYTHKVSPMRMDNETSGGTTHGTIKKIPELVLSLLDSANVTYGDSSSDLHDIDLETPELVNTSEITGLFTGDVTVHQDGGFSVDDSIVIAGSDPVPCTVRAIIARTDITGR